MKIILLLAALATSSQAFYLPDSMTLADALEAARSAWGVDDTGRVEFRFDALNSCALRDNPVIAVTQSMDTVTTMKFEDGTESVTHSLTWVIRLNSECDWSRLNVRNTVIHEMGHVLIGPEYHSKNPKSVMFWIVQGDQSILPEDRSMLRVGR